MFMGTHSINDECIACGACEPLCPVNAISAGEPYTIEKDTCIDCGECDEVCPVDAITWEETAG
jgi:NAD-dependent dihydropyrimidine dehydrogenase PreA subunit